MPFQFKKTLTRVSVLTALLPAAAIAAETGKILRDPGSAPKRGEYAYDTFGRVVRTTVVGDCVYTTYWTPDTATLECHPGLFAKFRAPAPTAAVQPAPEEPAPLGYEPPQYAEPAPTEALAPVEEVVEEPVEEAVEEFVEEPVEEVVEEAVEAPVEEVVEEAVEAPVEEVVEAPVDEFVEAPVEEFVEEPVEEVVEAPVEEVAEEAVEAPVEEVAEAPVEEVVEEAVEEPVEEVAEAPIEEVAEEPALAVTEAPQEDFYAPGDAPDLVPVPAPSPLAEEDDRISEPSMYYEEEGVAQDDGIIAESQYYEEEGVAPEDAIIGQSQYYEEESVPQDEGIVARSQFYEEEGKEPEDLISEPMAPEETVVAAAEEERPMAPEEAVVATAEEEKEPTPVMLPLTVTLEAEPWFDFDRYFVRSDARDKLDQLVGELTGVEYDEVVVVGHADRIGTPEYNQRLSERRARSVKSYLVGKGVPADRIKTEGRGEFEPATDPAFCQGLRKQKLIDCLQPDRRVEVTITGTKLQQ